MEVMCTVQSDVLGRSFTDVEECNPELGGVLVRRSAAHPLHTGVVGNVIAVLQNFAALNLPAHPGIIDVVQAVSMQGVREGRTWKCPKRQVKRC